MTDKKKTESRSRGRPVKNQIEPIPDTAPNIARAIFHGADKKIKPIQKWRSHSDRQNPSFAICYRRRFSFCSAKRCSRSSRLNSLLSRFWAERRRDWLALIRARNWAGDMAILQAPFIHITEIWSLLSHNIRVEYRGDHEPTPKQWFQLKAQQSVVRCWAFLHSMSF